MGSERVAYEANGVEKNYRPAAAMVETVSTLFPCAEVRLGRPDSLADREFGFFPGLSHPNLILPTENKRAAARTVWRFSAASGVREIATRSVTSVALRVGALRLAHDTISVYGDGEAVTDHLAKVLGCPVEVSVGIGSPRANRKPVVEVFDRSGRTLAFAKIGVDDVSRADVAAEAANLSRAANRVPPQLEIPTVIDLSDWRANLVLVMTALPTRIQRPSGRRVVPVTLMEDFSRGSGSSWLPLASTPFWRCQRERAEKVGSHAKGTRLAAALDRLEDKFGEVVVETGAWHGDWTPWNMAWQRDRLQLWDFERLDDSGLVGLDLVHYAVNETLQRTTTGRDQLDQALGLSQRLLARSSRTATAILASYLAAITLRYSLAAGTDRGHLIVDRARFMLEALERAVSAQGQLFSESG